MQQPEKRSWPLHIDAPNSRLTLARPCCQIQYSELEVSREEAFAAAACHGSKFKAFTVPKAEELDSAASAVRGPSGRPSPTCPCWPCSICSLAMSRCNSAHQVPMPCTTLSRPFTFSNKYCSHRVGGSDNAGICEEEAASIRPAAIHSAACCLLQANA